MFDPGALLRTIVASPSCATLTRLHEVEERQRRDAPVELAQVGDRCSNPTGPSLWNRLVQ